MIITEGKFSVQSIFQEMWFNISRKENKQMKKFSIVEDKITDFAIVVTEIYTFKIHPINSFLCLIISHTAKQYQAFNCNIIYYLICNWIASRASIAEKSWTEMETLFMVSGRNKLILEVFRKLWGLEIIKLYWHSLVWKWFWIFFVNTAWDSFPTFTNWYLTICERVRWLSKRWSVFA